MYFVPHSSYRKTYTYAIAWIYVCVCLGVGGGLKNIMYHEIVCRSLYINVIAVKKPTLLAYFSNVLLHSTILFNTIIASFLHLFHFKYR